MTLGVTFKESKRSCALSLVSLVLLRVAFSFLLLHSVTQIKGRDRGCSKTFEGKLKGPSAFRLQVKVYASFSVVHAHVRLPAREQLITFSGGFSHLGDDVSCSKM